MVLYDPSNDPDDPNKGGGGQTTGGGGCGPGLVQSELAADGSWAGNEGGTQFECVSPEEADRRRGIYSNPGSGAETGGGADGGGSGPASPSGPAKYNFGQIPLFHAPKYGFSETFQAPSFDEAYNDPGYQFASKEGLRALSQSQAAKGGARTGGAYKDLAAWNSNYAAQRYGDVYQRDLTGYKTRLDTYNQGYDREYQGARDEYAPLNQEYLLKNTFGSAAAMEDWRKQWDKWFHDTVSADTLYGSGVA